jgi:acetolactate decarboxylase
MMKKHTKGWLVAVAGFLVLAHAGCQSSRIMPRQEFADTITHAGVYADLAQGNYEGFFAITNLHRYGDHGLGTFHGLDGEMIMYSGVIYRAEASGALAVAPISNQTPFAVVTFFDADRMFDVEKMDQPLFKRALDMRRKQHRTPMAIQVQGLYKSLTIRSVPKQEMPWRTLDVTLNEDARQMVLTNVTGTMVGYYFPDYLSVLHPGGYHLHFIDETRQVGGHVLDFTIAHARISIDASPRLQVFLPVN